MEGLWEVYEQSYNVPKSSFLEKKKTIDLYAVYKDGARVIGFTGIRYRTIHVELKKYKGLYIGQTAILSEYRGMKLMQRTVIKMLKRHFLKAPHHKLIIWNNALTYRPYLVMAKGLKNYYPHPDREECQHRKAIQDAIGHSYYGDSYNPNSGIVNKPENIMQEHERLLSEKELSDKHIAYYLQKNPMVKHGHGMICYADGSVGNLVHYLTRKFRKDDARKN